MGLTPDEKKIRIEKLKEFQDKSGMISVLIVLLKIYGYLNYDELKELFYYYTDRDYNIDLLISSRLFKFNSVIRDDYYVYYEYLNYLESIGLNKELVDAFYCIVSNEENKNPSSYLESIDYKQLFMASKGEFVKKLKK